MTKRMLIDASHPEETRVVVLDGNRVEEFDLETATRRPLKGNMPSISVACHGGIEVKCHPGPRPATNCVRRVTRPCGAPSWRLWCPAPAATAAGGFPGRIARLATRGLKAGRAAVSNGRGPGLEPGRRSCPPRLPWFSRVPSCRVRQRGDGCAHGPNRPQPASGPPHSVAGPPVPGTVATPRPFKGYRGRDQARPPRACTALCAVRGPPSEDDRRRMPKDAAPRFRLRPGPAIPLRRRPRRGAEHRRP